MPQDAKPRTSIGSFPITPQEMEKIVNDVSNLIRNMQGGYVREMEDEYRKMILDELSLRGVDPKSAAAKFLAEQGLSALAGGRQGRTRMSPDQFAQLSPTGQAGFAARYGAPRSPNVGDFISDVGASIGEGEGLAGQAFTALKRLLTGGR